MDKTFVYAMEFHSKDEVVREIKIHADFPNLAREMTRFGFESNHSNTDFVGVKRIPTGDTVCFGLPNRTCNLSECALKSMTLAPKRFFTSQTIKYQEKRPGQQNDYQLEKLIRGGGGGGGDPRPRTRYNRNSIQCFLV